MDVALINWPEDEPRRLELAAQHRPRLLLVNAEGPAPIATDPLEDWIRLPAPENDVAARVHALTIRSGSAESPAPRLGDDDLLHHGDRWVALPVIEARLMAALIARVGAVVSREALIRVGWPGENPSRNVLDVHMLRLRRRIEPIGLAIRTVRSRGYVLES